MATGDKPHVIDPQRVARYQAATIQAFLDMVGSAGLDSPSEIRPFHVHRRVSGPDVQSFSQQYPWMPEGFLLDEGASHKGWRRSWARTRTATPR